MTARYYKSANDLKISPGSLLFDLCGSCACMRFHNFLKTRKSADKNCTLGVKVASAYQLFKGKNHYKGVMIIPKTSIPRKLRVKVKLKEIQTY